MINVDGPEQGPVEPKAGKGSIKRRPGVSASLVVSGDYASDLRRVDGFLQHQRWAGYDIAQIMRINDNKQTYQHSTINQLALGKLDVSLVGSPGETKTK